MLLGFWLYLLNYGLFEVKLLGNFLKFVGFSILFYIGVRSGSSRGFV